MIFKEVSENSFIIYFSDKIDINISKRIKFLFNEIHHFEEIIDVVFSYTSIVVVYDILKCDSIELFEKIKEYEKCLNINKDINEQLLEIPTFYGEEVGFDLEKVSKEIKKPIKEIIKLHTSKDYHVFSIGFLPAFAYLGELHHELFTNRLESPRVSVPKNSVAIANLQTAIYPKTSPGGWNIIGRTPINIYDKKYKNFSLIDVNSKFRFKSISKEEFNDLGGEI